MHEGFLNYMETRNPDILVAHAGNWADFPHLHRRLADPNRMSPINQVLVPKSNGYQETAQPIKGRLVFDSAARVMTGSGFESKYHILGLKSGIPLGYFCMIYWSTKPKSASYV